MREPKVPAAYVLESRGELLPSGSASSEGARGFVAYRRDVRDALRGAGFDLDGDGAVRDAGLEGRGALVELDVPELTRCGVRVLLRRHRRGGLPARLGATRFAAPERPFEELRLAAALRERGVRTPAVLAARARRADGGRGFELAIATERVEGGVDLAARLATARGAERRALIEGAGRFVRELFDAGLVHVDLHPKNLVVRTGAEPEFFVVDLDRCELREHVAPPRRYAMLSRFLRWLRKYAERVPFSRADALRFLGSAVPADVRDAAYKRLVKR